MKQAKPDRAFPTIAYVAVAVLMAITAFAIVARRSGVDIYSAHTIPAAESRQLVFKDMADGGIEIIDAVSRAQVGVIAPDQEQSFVRMTMRSMAQHRKHAGIGNRDPFTLARSPEGILTLDDPATGRKLVLDAFGSLNVAEFAKLMPASRDLKAGPQSSSRPELKTGPELNTRNDRP